MTESSVPTNNEAWLHLRAKLACGLVELSPSSFATGERRIGGRESSDATYVHAIVKLVVTNVFKINFVLFFLCRVL